MSGKFVISISYIRIEGIQRHSIGIYILPTGTQYWWKYFTPSLVAWVGSQPDPFGTNLGVGSEALLVWN